jgi:hypothetical protein
MRCGSRLSSPEKNGNGGSVFSALEMREGRRRRGWADEVWTTAETLFKALGSWPRRQVARGAWRTRGGDGLKRSAT